MLREFRRVAVVLAVSAACAAPPALAKEAVQSSAAHDQAVQKILASDAYKKALAVLDEQHERIVEDGITLTEIPAPPFKEAKRAHPKTTYSIGRLGGGTSVNSIPVDAWMEVDMRSEDVDALKRVEDRFLTIVKEAVATENFARSTKEGEIKLKLDPIGDRPAGTTAVDSDIVQYAISAIKAGGYEPNLNRSSTDSNLPMSLGVPAITVGRMAPGTYGRAHALDEWLDAEKGPMVKAMGTTLSTILVTTGMQ